MKHDLFTTKLDSYLSGELSKDERQLVAEHLLVCETCRHEHDALKFGAALLQKLPSKDAPESAWSRILEDLDGRETPAMGLIPETPWLNWRKGFAFAVSLVAVSALATAVFIRLFTESGKPVAVGPGDPAATSNVADPPIDIASSQIPADNSNIAPTNFNSNTNSQTANAAVLNNAPQPSWQVETLAGTPTIGDAAAQGEISVGQMLVTDSRSKAKITVADIGSVEIAPNSLVKFVGTGKDQHRLALERGGLHAKILAPPRLFVVDTPTGQAVDLGCEYTLEVDRAGNSVLHVTSGFVALENNGRESIVPAGMMSLTMKGKNLGTPFRADAGADFRRTLEQFDFENGGSTAVRQLLSQADLYDVVTLWHLLSRVPKADRDAVFNKLSEFAKPPAGVTREGILGLDKKMLAAWRTEVENVWFN